MSSTISFFDDDIIKSIVLTAFSRRGGRFRPCFSSCKLVAGCKILPSWYSLSGKQLQFEARALLVSDHTAKNS